MICDKCNNSVPESFAFCPYCGQRMRPATPKAQEDAFSPARTVGKEVGGVAEEKAPVIARSAMQKEEEYSGRYESGDMPEPSIRFSRNLDKKQQQKSAEPVVEQQPAQPEGVKCAACGAGLREGAKFCNICGSPVKKEVPPAEEKPAPAPEPMPTPVQQPAEPEIPTQQPAQPEAPAVEQEPAASEGVKCATCGAGLRESAKFCNICGRPVQKEVPPAEEKPAPAPEPMPAPVQQPAEPELPVQQPAQPEPPAVEHKPTAPEGVKCAACGAGLRESAKFCNICGNPIQKAEEPKVEQKPEEASEPAQQEPAAPMIPPVQQPAAPSQQPAPAQQKRPALKKCPLCGTVVPAEAKACSGCGVAFRLPEPRQPAVPEQPAAPAGKKCAVCGSDIRPEAKFCNICGSTAAAAPAQPGAKPAKAKKEKPAKSGKKSKAPLVIALCVALVLVAVLVVGLLTDWFGLNGPMTQIYSTTEKTIRSGSFSADLTLTVQGMEVEGSAECELDIDKRELTALVELHCQGETAYCGIYDGYALWQYPDGEVGSMDVSDILDPIFDELEEDKSMNQVLEEAVELVLDSSGMDRYMDADETYARVRKCLSSTSWLKENAGYSAETEDGVKLHVFQPKLGDLALAGVEALESAFEDADDYEEAVDSLKDYKSDLNDQADVELVFGIKSGKLVQLSIDLTAYDSSMIADVTFDKIGDTKVDTGMLKDMLEKAE